MKSHKEYIKMFETHSQIVQVGKYQLNYMDIGEGQPVILMPSFPQSAGVYLPMLEHLLHRKLRFIGIDLPGWIGKSSPERYHRWGDYLTSRMHSISELTKDLIGDQQPIILGYSAGGPLAAMMLKQIPQTKQLVLISSPFKRGDVANVPRYVRRMYRFGRYFVTDKMLSDIMVRRFRSTIDFSKLTVEETEAIEWMYEEMGKMKMKTALNIMEQLARQDVPKILSNWGRSHGKGKFTYVGAEKDLMFVKRANSFMENNSFEGVNSKSIVIPGVDHGHLFMRPQEFADRWDEIVF
jgi:pimeloyl-ACP methyl ester carboxylesterase